MGCRASLCIIRKYLLQPNGQARCCCRWCTGPCRCSSNGRGRGRGNKSQPGQPGFLGLVMMKCSRLHMHITAQDGVYSPSECCSQQGCGHLISSCSPSTTATGIISQPSTYGAINSIWEGWVVCRRLQYSSTAPASIRSPVRC